MSEREAGWYPDPTGENQERFWDGDSWTEYYAPIVPSDEQEHGAGTAREDYPYLAELNHRPDVMVAPGTAGDGWLANQPWGPAAQPRDDDGTKVFGAGVRGTPGGTAAVASLVVLAVLVVAGLGWWLVSGRNDPDDPDMSNPPTASPGSGAVVTGTFAADGETSETIEAGGRYEGDLSLTEQTTLAIDVRGDGGAVDLTLTVQDDAGDEVYSSDDRGRDLVDMLDGTSLDPFGVPTLEAGDYTVVLEDVNGATTSFTATSAPITDEVRIGSSATANVPADGAWIGLVQVADEGEYTVDVRDDGSEDPMLATLDSEGRERMNDDRDYSGDDYDPQLVAPMPSGPLVLIVTEWAGDATSVTISVTGPA
ncbi:DUF2510 domain-containing protein [Ruania zhangjianzhongii]|uniref:DUF2510 domain-containing protein n=1 Tax=Ruania zhangjianzhongii TaxID=2603206 RepID=UPI00143CE631|nr:DUF2510 domain-containing protein [Ruania zhangjianzhongii]